MQPGYRPAYRSAALAREVALIAREPVSTLLLSLLITFLSNCLSRCRHCLDPRRAPGNPRSSLSRCVSLSYRSPPLVSARATPSRYLVLRSRLPRSPPSRGIGQVPSSDPAPRKALFRGLHAPSFPGGPPLLPPGVLRGVAARPRIQPTRTSRSPPYRLPPGLARSIQQGAERNDFPHPGHVPDTQKDGPNGPRRSDRRTE
jgi:hypothetical protein